MTDIDDRLRDHYRGLQLDDEEVDRISVSGSATPSNLVALSASRWRSLSRAATVLLVIAMSIGFHNYGTQVERTTRTLNEAAMNHSTRLQLEFESAEIGKINEFMTQLPFEVALPSQFGEQLTLLGARYCTINGELAAHVKFIDTATDKQVSLFMTRNGEGLKAMDETRERVDGVNVKLWNESGLFYVMATRSPII